MKPVLETAGAQASRAWLAARHLDRAPDPHWYVEITLASDSVDTSLEINIYPEEWGFVLRRGSRVSSVRVTDIPFVHGRDDYGLVHQTCPLEHIGQLLTYIERRFALTLARAQVLVRSNLARANAAVRAWLLEAR